MANKSVDKKYHYLYKTTNLLNGKYYYGMHSTNNLYDNYLGSGSYLRNAIYKHGKDNFSFEILKYFDSREELIQGEINLINEELLNDKLCMNLKPGGSGGFNNLEHQIKCTRAANLKNINNQYYKNKVTVKDNNGNTFCVSIYDIRYLSGELVGVTKNKIVVKDKNGNTLQVCIDDPRYLSGELKHTWKDRKHSNETKEKIGKSNSIKQKGKLFSQFGKIKSLETKQKISNTLSKTFYVFDLNDKFISKEKNINEYAKLNNLNPSSIVKVLNGKYKQTGNLKFSYNFI